jgi:sortase A
MPLGSEVISPESYRSGSPIGSPSSPLALCRVTDQLAAQEHGEPAPPAGPPDPEPARVTRWDRPPEPHDWRFFVGGLGKLLITIGLLMFGFVAYQLWGTGIETARAQNKLENQFEEFVEANSTAIVTQAPAATTLPASPAPTAPSATAGSVPATSVSASPPSSVPVPTAPVATEQDIPPVERGQVLARLEIPKIGKVDGAALYVVPGVSVSDLKKGPGHYPDTPLPGQLGNAAIAGHRTTFGEPFRDIDELAEGDEIIVTMANGERFTYAVTSTQIVGPDDYYVVTTTDPTVAQLTLTSCHPVYTAKQRIAVHAVLQPQQSAPVGEPTYYDLEANAAEEGDPAIESDDSTVSSIPTDTGTSADRTAVDEAPVGDSNGDSNGSGDPLPSATASPPEVEDAFADGWFHDSGAWLQIALWGGALILIALGVLRLSRHFRRYSVGIAAGVLPFLICLYFFYQNINRLLPPGF